MDHDGSPRAGLEAGTRVRAAARANLAASFGMVLVSYGAPGSVLLTLFMQDWLRADKWQIGLIMTMAFLGPVLEPLGAHVVEKVRRRRLVFMIGFLFNRVPFLLLALVPFLSSRDVHRDRGIALVLAVVAFTRIGCHLGNPAWWSWMADLVPEARRGRFFGLRSQATSAVAALSFIVAMALLHVCGGMHNRLLVSALFAAGALSGTIDILLYWNVPEPAMPPGEPGVTSWLPSAGFVRDLLTPFRLPEYRSLILGMAMWSFSANLVMPFVPIYQYGERLRGCQLGLGLSWKYLAVLNVAGSVAAMVSSRWWARWADRVGPRRLLTLGSGYLFVNLCYLLVGPGRYSGLLILVAATSGALNAAWTVSTNQLILGMAPRCNRSFFVAAYNATNGLLMAGGPLLGGLLADLLPMTRYRLPCGLPVCYFHVLLTLATVGGAIALSLLLRSPAFRGRALVPTQANIELEEANEYAMV